MCIINNNQIIMVNFSIVILFENLICWWKLSMAVSHYSDNALQNHFHVKFNVKKICNGVFYIYLPLCIPSLNSAISYEDRSIISSQ